MHSINLYTQYEQSTGYEPMENDFVKIDLHIHTPASSCYQGKKTDDEYLRILRKAKSRKLKIISFTDHNSIEGYRTLLKIKDKITDEKRSLLLLTDSEQAKIRLKTIDEDLELFNDMLILPGLEFEVRNGIHLLIIFNDTVPLEEIYGFIIDGGYSPENFGNDITTGLSNWDIFALFEESKKHDCIIIDAHTDSSKGILNTIPSGAPRAACFSSPQLSAVCYKNEEQKEKLQNTLKTSKEYLRTIPLSFLKFSDAHIADNVGSPSTWVKLEKISFDALKTAFSNPSELVSTEEPSIIKILDDLIRLPNSFGIPDLSEKSLENFSKYICAFSNSEGGYILVGVTTNKAKVGIFVEDQLNKESYRAIIDKMLDCLRKVEPIQRPSFNMYPLQNNRVVISMYVPKSPSFTNLKEDGRIYSIKDDSLYQLAVNDIVHIVEDKVLKDIESKIIRRLQSVENDCNLIKNLFSSIPIIRFFDTNSVEARLKPILEASMDLDHINIRKLEKIRYTGTSRGTLTYVREPTQPRLSYTYLRYTLPLFSLRNINYRSVLKDTIYIVPGGGLYFSNRDYPFFSERYGQIIKLCKESLPSKYNVKFTVCFLKSSFLLWYLKNKHDSIDLFETDIFNNLRLPALNMKRPDTIEIINSINDNFDKIVGLETTFLLNMKNVKKDDIMNYFTEHNLRVDKLAYEIDRLIYKLLNLSSNDISTIEQNLRLNEIYLPTYSLFTT